LSCNGIHRSFFPIIVKTIPLFLSIFLRVNDEAAGSDGHGKAGNAGKEFLKVLEKSWKCVLYAEF